MRDGPRVLVVEDDPTIGHMLGKIFEAWGWRVARAGTVAEALGFRAERLDLVVLDLMLPDGDGLEVLRSFRLARNRAKVSISTAKDVEALHEAIDLLPDQLLFKPFIFEPLQEFARSIASAWTPTAD